MKNAHVALQETITCTKNSGKGWIEWEKTCVNSGFPPQKLKTPLDTRFANKVILFKETLACANAINMCYQRHSLHM